jgi:hypothetical protein
MPATAPMHGPGADTEGTGEDRQTAISPRLLPHRPRNALAFYPARNEQLARRMRDHLSVI